MTITTTITIQHNKYRARRSRIWVPTRDTYVSYENMFVCTFKVDRVQQYPIKTVGIPLCLCMVYVYKLCVCVYIYIYVVYAC